MKFHEFLKSLNQTQITVGWLRWVLMPIQDRDQSLSILLYEIGNFRNDHIIELGPYGLGPWANETYDFDMGDVEDILKPCMDRYGMYDYKKQYVSYGKYIPMRMMDGIFRWVNEGILPGDFLQAVIKNDLFGAVAGADDENQFNLLAYIHFFHNNTPGDCFGSSKKMLAWRKAHNKRKEKENNDTKD